MSSRGRDPLHRPGGAPRGVCLPHPPALPVGKGAGRCAPMGPRRVLLPGFYVFVRWWPAAWSGSGLQGAGVASELFVVVRQGSVSSSFRRRSAGGRAGSVPVCPAVLLFTSPHALFL